MDIKSYMNNQMLKVRVIPNSKKLELKEENGRLKLYLKSVPEKDKANFGLIQFFKKEFGLRVEIQSGRKSREKVLMVLG